MLRRLAVALACLLIAAPLIGATVGEQYGAAAWRIIKTMIGSSTCASGSYCMWGGGVYYTDSITEAQAALDNGCGDDVTGSSPTGCRVVLSGGVIGNGGTTLHLAGTGGEIADGSITAADIATDAVTSNDILNDTVALTTDTSGDYVATITNSDGFITVSGTGTEGRAVTLALAATAATQQELDDKSAASSTSGNVPKFSGTTGDLVDTGVAVDGSNNITTAGALSAGGSTGASTFTLRNMADSGWVECGVSGTTFTCAVDADGTPDGTL